WTITLRTAERPDRLNEAFLFFSEDSTVDIEERVDPGRWVPVGEAAPAAVRAAGSAGAATRRPIPEDAAAPIPPAVPSGPTRAAPLPPAAPGPPAGGPQPAPRGAPRPNARIRVDAAQLDDLVGLAGELAVLSDNLVGLREVPGMDAWLHALESLQRV